MAAAEEVIAERGAGGLTVVEVARRAGTAVGTIYTRFPDKDTLLRTLHDQLLARASVTADAVFDPSRRRNLPVRDLLAGCVRGEELPRAPRLAACPAAVCPHA